MLGIFMAVALATGGHDVGTPVAGGDRAVRAISEAAALSKACPAMLMDRHAIAASLARIGVSIAPLMPEIAAQARHLDIKYAHLGYRETCAIARRLFGSNGSVAAGYLSDR